MPSALSSKGLSFEAVSAVTLKSPVAAGISEAIVEVFPLIVS
jgi:hypothetical protein